MWPTCWPLCWCFWSLSTFKASEWFFLFDQKALVGNRDHTLSSCSIPPTCLLSFRVLSSPTSTSSHRFLTSDLYPQIESCDKQFSRVPKGENTYLLSKCSFQAFLWLTPCVLDDGCSCYTRDTVQTLLWTFLASGRNQSIHKVVSSFLLVAWCTTLQLLPGNIQLCNWITCFCHLSSLELCLLSGWPLQPQWTYIRNIYGLVLQAWFVNVQFWRYCCQPLPCSLLFDIHAHGLRTLLQDMDWSLWIISTWCC